MDCHKPIAPSLHNSTPSPPHVIRLRGPWECQPLASTADASQLPAGGTLPMPGDWGGLLGHNFRGKARFLRSFNRPTGLEVGQPVWLVIESVQAQGRVELNGQDLGPAGNQPSQPAFRMNVAHWLQPRNELIVEVSCPADAQEPGGLGLVCLEIEDS